MLIGFLLGWFALDLSAGNGAPTDGIQTFPPICALWVIVIPLCDCVSLMLRRRALLGKRRSERSRLGGRDDRRCGWDWESGVARGPGSVAGMTGVVGGIGDQA